MKQTHHIGYVQTPSVKNLSNVKNALVENGLVPLTTPNEMLPDAIVEGLKKLEIHDYGMIHEGKYRIRYFDIDGKILKIEYVAEGGKLTPPAKTPNYDPDYLIFDEWNYDIENYVVEQPTDVGATYKTVDDATYMFLRITGKLGLNFSPVISGYTSIDWGDGIVNNESSHRYSKIGYYIVKIFGDVKFTPDSSGHALGSHNQACTKLYISNTITSFGTGSFSNRVLRNFSNLELISIPKQLNDVFYLGAPQLKTLILPKNMTPTTVIQNSISLVNLIIGENCQRITGGFCQSIIGLKEIILPPKVLVIESSAFYNCGHNNVWLPKSLTTMQKSTFFATNAFVNNMFVNSLATIETSSIAANTNNNNFIIWVNDDIIENLKVATNWSTFASQMKPLSWYPSLNDPNEN